MSPIRREITLNNIKLSYLEWEPVAPHGEATPLLLLHGLADVALVWTSLGNYLGPEYHIIAPDMRGHGESDKPENGYTFEDNIQDLEALMTHLNWDNAHILGHSWTGKLATIWAQQNPQRFRSMMLVDPIFITKMPSFLKLTFPILYHTLETLKGMGPFSTYEEAESQARLLKKYANWNELQRLIFQESIESKPDQTWGSKFTKPARDQIFDQVVEVAGLTQDVNIPTLFIQPEKGVNRMDWQIKPYQKYLRNLTIKKVPGNHWAFLGDAETFNQAIGEFLTNLPGRRGAQTT